MRTCRHEHPFGSHSIKLPGFNWRVDRLFTVNEWIARGQIKRRSAIRSAVLDAQFARSPRMATGPGLLDGFTGAQCQIRRRLPLPNDPQHSHIPFAIFHGPRSPHRHKGKPPRLRASAFNDRPRPRFLHAMPTTTGDLHSFRVARTTQIRDSSRQEARMRAVPMCPMISASRLAWKNRISRLKKTMVRSWTSGYSAEAYWLQLQFRKHNDGDIDERT